MINVEVLGTEFVAARFKKEIRAFQAAKIVQMRTAAKVVQAEVVHRVVATFGSGQNRHTQVLRRQDRRLGPLSRSIGRRVFRSKADVVALIRPAAKAFYGRFQETGLTATYDRKARTVFLGGHFRTLKAGAFTFRLPPKPFLAPAAQAKRQQVIDILGDAYEVFVTGRSR